MRDQQLSFCLARQSLPRLLVIILYVMGAFFSMMLTYDLLVKIIPFGEAHPFLEEFSKALFAIAIIFLLKLKDLKKVHNSAFILGFVFGFMEALNQLFHNGLGIAILQNLTAIGHGLWTSTIIAVVYRQKPVSIRNICVILGTTFTIGFTHFVYNNFMKAPISPPEFIIGMIILLFSAVLTVYARGNYR